MPSDMVITSLGCAGREADAHGFSSEPLWTTWGPQLADPARWQHTRTVKLVARNVGRPLAEIAELLLKTRHRGRYILLRRLAATHHSLVYAAVDRRLAREVAIKIHHNTDDRARRRAIVEARTNAEVEHPNIMRIHDIGEHDGQIYSVSELCECDLQSWCIRADWREILARITEAGAGLSQLHSAGYVHGDIKPLNILIRDGAAKLADFGHADRPGASLRLGGTAGYIAPEVATGNRTVSGDVFALAVTAWACLFGALPFGQLSGDAGAALLAGVQRANSGAIEPPQLIPRGMPAKVVALLEEALHADPVEAAVARPVARRSADRRHIPAAPMVARLHRRSVGRERECSGLLVLGHRLGRGHRIGAGPAKPIEEHDGVLGAVGQVEHRKDELERFAGLQAKGGGQPAGPGVALHCKAVEFGVGIIGEAGVDGNWIAELVE
jgi:hypothetical protein